MQCAFFSNRAGFTVIGSLSHNSLDALNHAAQFASNSRGWVTQQTDAAGGLWSYQYDAAGNVTKTIDPLGHTTQAAYDLNGQPTSQTPTAPR